MNPPINTLKGELQKRPNIHRVRAMDVDSRSEELEYKTTITQNLIVEAATRLIQNKLALSEKSENINEEDLQREITSKIEDLLTDYTSLAEKWGNHILAALQIYFNIADKSSDAFSDLLTCARQFYEVYEDTSKIGFNIRVHNPKNVWMVGVQDIKYTSGVSGDRGTPYAIGTIHVKELSEIIEEFPQLTIEEIEHLREIQNEYLMQNAKTNVGGTKTGIDSIIYTTYDRAVYQERQFAESQIQDSYNHILSDFQMNASSFAQGYKYVVVKAYHCSKKKIGSLTFLDEEGNPQTILVDETYEASPNEISIEWGYVNQWYEHVKIGRDIYLVKPVTILDYCPIIGMVYEAKNSPPASLVDLMKPYQMLFNLVMNQLWELLNKEIGNVGAINLRRIPRTKDGDENDAIDAWEQNARDRGIIFDDDSPENTGAPMQNTTIAKNVDLTRSQEMQFRLNTAVQLQEMCWQLVGMNRQRLGASLATQTATANQNDLTQSFAQTEPYFTAHNCVLGQLYQAIVDAAQYIESKKPTSIINFITPQGESTFLEVMGSELKLKDLFVMITSRAEDQQLVNEFRQLSQAMLQNGASIYDVSLMFTDNSIRSMQKVFKDLKAKNDAALQQQQQNEVAIAQQQQQTEMAKLEQEDRHFQIETQKDIYLGELKANTDITKAELNTYFQKPETDVDGDGVPDIMEIANHQIKQQEILRKTNLENKKLSLQMQEFIQKKEQQKVDNEIAKEKLSNEKEKIKIAKKRPAPKRK